jgi:hypothetical protein
MKPFRLNQQEIQTIINNINAQSKRYTNRRSIYINNRLIENYGKHLENIAAVYAYDQLYQTDNLKKINHLYELVVSPIIFNQNMQYTGEKHAKWFSDYKEKNSEGINELLYFQYENYIKYTNQTTKDDVQTFISFIRNNIINYFKYFQRKRRSPLEIFARENSIKAALLYSLLNSKIDLISDPLPQAKVEPSMENIPVEIALQWILASYKCRSEEAFDIIYRFIQSKNIFLTTNISQQPYSMPINKHFGSCVVIFYNGTLKSVFDLAHEIGHVLHQELCDDKKFPYSNPNFLLSEVSSIVSEMILASHLHDRNLISDNYLELRHLTMLKHSTKMLHLANRIYSISTRTAISLNMDEELDKILRDHADLINQHVDEILRFPFYSFSYLIGHRLANIWCQRINTDQSFNEYLAFLRDSSSYSFEEIILLHKINF